MSEFKTPIKNKPLDKITIPASPFLNKLGYGTGVSVMQLVRSPRAEQFRSPWPFEERLDNNLCYFDRVKAEADLLRRMSHPNIVRFGTFNRGKIVYLEACDLSLGDVIGERIVDVGEPLFPEQILKVSTDSWRAPEVVHGGEVSCKTDIWALGLTLWEMMSLMPPHALLDDVSELSDTLDDIKTYYDNIHGRRPSIPMRISEKQYAQPLALFYCCTDTVASMRPTAQHLSVAARDMLHHGEASTS